MDVSATRREQRRQETARRITRRAQVLTEERGLDGFTMDELADAADVSRRTLFNYFPGKVDAVLGPLPVVSPAAQATFLAGGPTGRLVDDLAVLARDVLDTHGLEREDVERGTRLVTTTPRLLAAVHERFEQLTAGFADLVREREGDRVSPAQARLLVRLLVSVFDAALVRFVDGDERSMPDLFDETLRSARDLLA